MLQTIKIILQFTKHLYALFITVSRETKIILASITMKYQVEYFILFSFKNGKKCDSIKVKVQIYFKKNGDS